MRSRPDNHTPGEAFPSTGGRTEGTGRARSLLPTLPEQIDHALHHARHALHHARHAPCKISAQGSRNIFEGNSNCDSGSLRVTQSLHA
eukprot:353640-Chlamydomonas_euryale.AAC.3